MKLHFEFDNLDELDAWTQWAAQRGQYTETRAGDLVHIVDTRPVTAEGAVIPVETESQDSDEAANAGAGEAPSTDPVPEGKSKRKRRTKAEIAADKAAAKAIPAPPGDEYLAHIAAKSERSDALDEAEETAALEAAPSPTPHFEIEALAATIDGADKMAHMNEGRDFIAKHGFPKYNETFALADVPSNIAAHTPEQAALHRAAMQWLIAQVGVK